MATSSSGAGNPRLRSFNLCRFISKPVDSERTLRSSIEESQPIKSALTGTAYSAAAVGVGARKSEAKSISVVSVSCPTADINGISLSAAARTTDSSLNPHKSSIEPPPLATIINSGLGIAPPGVSRLKPFIAAATSGAHLSP